MREFTVAFVVTVICGTYWALRDAPITKVAIPLCAQTRVVFSAGDVAFAKEACGRRGLHWSSAELSLDQTHFDLTCADGNIVRAQVRAQYRNLK